MQRICLLLMIFLSHFTMCQAMTMVNPLNDMSMITSDYGYRDFDGKFHPGIDLGENEGTPIYAAAGGTIINMHDLGDGYGRSVVIDHGIDEIGQHIYTRYGHCVGYPMGGSMVTSARELEGSSVRAGNIIGYVGNTGLSYGAHLHFEVMVNPPSHLYGGFHNPREFLVGLPPSAGDGYGGMASGAKMKFDADADFGKPFRDMTIELGKKCTEAIHLLADIAKYFLITLFVIDIILRLTMFIFNQEVGEKFFLWIIYKMVMYLFLVLILFNWGDLVGNLFKTAFTGFAGAAMGTTGDAAATAVSDPMSIVAQGFHLVAPIIEQLANFNGVIDALLKAATLVSSVVFLIIYIVCFLIISKQVFMAYCEFYVTVMVSFVTFSLAGEKHLRVYAANGMNSLFAVCINLMFYCMFSLMLQTTLQILSVESFYTETPAETVMYDQTDSKYGEPINSIDVLMSHIRSVESYGGNYYCDDGGYAYGAYQVLYDNWDNWCQAYIEAAPPNQITTLDVYMEYGGSYDAPDFGKTIENSGSSQGFSDYRNEPKVSKYAWSPTNQDKIARFILQGYYDEFGSWEMAAKCWNQGIGGRNNSAAQQYWQKVIQSPASAGYREARIDVNLWVFLEMTAILLLFVFVGSTIGDRIIKQFGTGGGFVFTSNDD